MVAAVVGEVVFVAVIAAVELSSELLCAALKHGSNSAVMRAAKTLVVAHRKIPPMLG